MKESEAKRWELEAELETYDEIRHFLQTLPERDKLDEALQTLLTYVSVIKATDDNIDVLGWFAKERKR